MSSRKLTAEDLAQITTLAKRWGKIVVRQAFGDGGPGLDGDLSQREDVAVAAAAGLTAGLSKRPPPSKAGCWAPSSPVRNAAASVASLGRSVRRSCAAAPLNTRNPSAIVRLAAGLFFPQRPLRKLGVNGSSPAILHKIVGATAEVKSHPLAAKVLQLVGEFSIGGRHINRLTETIGTEMAEQRDGATEDYVHHCRQPPTTPAPALASISLDGGRLMTRATGQGVGVQSAAMEGRQSGVLADPQGRDVRRGSASSAAPVFFGRADGGQTRAGHPGASRSAPGKRVAAVGGIAFGKGNDPGRHAPAESRSGRAEASGVAAETHQGVAHLRGDDARLRRVGQDGRGGSVAAELPRGEAWRVGGRRRGVDLGAAPQVVLLADARRRLRASADLEAI